MKPATAVQKAPVIHVNNTKKTMRLDFSQGVKPLVRRMSAIRALADREVKKVRPKNSNRRQMEGHRRRSRVMAVLRGPKGKSKSRSTLHHIASGSNADRQASRRSFSYASIHARHRSQPGVP